MAPWLIDAGPLIALIRKADRDHQVCRGAAARLKGPLVTTWPALTEAVHVLGAQREQDAVLEMIERGAVAIAPLDRADIPRVRQLMRKYASQPMDLADATLVRVAEREGFHQIFTLDGDFRVYHIGRGRSFAIIP